MRDETARSLPSQSDGRLAAPLPETGATSPPPATTSSRSCGEIADLAAIFEPDVNVCVLRRPGVASLVESCVGALPAAWEWVGEVRAAVWTGNSLRVAMPSSMREWPASAVIDDVRLWAEILGDLAGVHSVGVRMRSLSAPMCPRFHVDRVGLRLVTTYLGQGTEWLDEQDVDRAWLGHAACGMADEVSGLIRPGAMVHSMGTCDVGLLKGAAWPGNERRGAVHRSPPGDGRRLVVTMDPLA